jgi:hypothetical protein
MGAGERRLDGRITAVWLLVGALVGLVGLVGCGGGGGAGTTTAASSGPGKTNATAVADSSSTVPKAAQPVGGLLGDLEQLPDDASCAQVVALIHPADLIEPSGGPSVANCGAIDGVLATLRAFQPGEAREFGTGALIDGDAGGKPISLVAALDQTGNFKLLGTYFLRSQIGTETPTGGDFQLPANGFVKALRADDCKGAHATLAPLSRLAYGSAKQFCSAFEDNYMASPTSVGSRLQADPAAKLVDFGGTRNARFLGMATEPAGYRTIIVGTVAGGAPLVLDVLPVEP